jgi:alkyl sulfatase BDS1-like metallo-beta-lactamase superfamily hydrolase
VLAKQWLAASYEQQGFQAESGAWRNYFLQAARELREGVTKSSLSGGSLAVIHAVPTENLIDALAARFNPAKSARPGTTIQFNFTDRNESVGFHVDESVLFPRMGETLVNPTATLTTTRAAFDAVLVGQMKVPEAVASGVFKIGGDGSALAAMLLALDQAPGGFNVVTP